MRYFIVDAFAEGPFTGNPAGVCLPEHPLDAATMQAIAAENKLSETAFVTPREDGYGLRWFTPRVEVPLCGHATLASAFVVTHFVRPDADAVHFETRSGALTVQKTGDLFTLDFPAREAQEAPVTPPMEAAIGAPVQEAHVYAGDLLLLLEDEERVQKLAPDFAAIEELAAHGVMVTAKGTSADFVSRFFAPNVGVAEDPVTGSAHTLLVPFWARRLGKETLAARQLSKRGGVLHCTLCGSRVHMAGKARLALQGEIVV